jgi:hypothetical protein
MNSIPNGRKNDPHDVHHVSRFCRLTATGLSTVSSGYGAFLRHWKGPKSTFVESRSRSTIVRRSVIGDDTKQSFRKIGQKSHFRSHIISDIHELTSRKNAWNVIWPFPNWKWREVIMSKKVREEKKRMSLFEARIENVQELRSNRWQFDINTKAVISLNIADIQINIKIHNFGNIRMWNFVKRKEQKRKGKETRITLNLSNERLSSWTQFFNCYSDDRNWFWC